MPTRQSVVGWERYTGHEILVSGKTYLVYQITKEPETDPDTGNLIPGTGVPVFAEYYDKGDVVHMTLRDDYDIYGRDATKEERFLESVFGKTRSAVIRESGFYITTGDYGIEDQYRGCLEQPVCVGNACTSRLQAPCFFCEVPLDPVNYGRDDNRAIVESSIRSAMRDEYDELKRRLLHDSLAYGAYCEIMGDIDPGDDRNDVPVEACVYNISSDRVALRVLRFGEWVQAVRKIPEADMKSYISSIDPEDRDGGNGLRTRAFLCQHDVPENLGRYALYMAVWNLGQAPGFYACRDQILARGGLKTQDVPGVLQEALCQVRLFERVARLTRFAQMDPPDVIIMKEIRLCTLAEIGIRDSSCIVSVDEDKFGDLFGVDPDGQRRDGKSCLFGDSELVALGAGFQRPGDASSLNPRYVWAYAPNFLMREKGGPIFDRKTWEYVRDKNGSVVMYETEPEDVLAALNSQAG